jgi:hypothetical protein
MSKMKLITLVQVRYSIGQPLDDFSGDLAWAIMSARVRIYAIARFSSKSHEFWPADNFSIDLMISMERAACLGEVGVCCVLTIFPLPGSDIAQGIAATGVHVPT